MFFLCTYFMMIISLFQIEFWRCVNTSIPGRLITYTQLIPQILTNISGAVVVTSVWYKDIRGSHGYKCMVQRY